VGTDQNPYQAYTDGHIYSDNPLNLVVALYQRALEATHEAESAMREGDIPRRTKAINKATSILTELLVSLDFERGGEISVNLKRLYSYMQQQLLSAHIRKVCEPIAEVSKLLTTLLEGWREAGKAQTSVPEAAPFAMDYAKSKAESASTAYVAAPSYGGYGEDGMSGYASTAYSF